MKRNLLFLLLAISSAHAASFDCTKASSTAEKLICRTPALSQADDHLYQDYIKAKQSTGNSPEFKHFTQQNWKKREQCSTVTCLADWYTDSSRIYQQLSSAKNRETCTDNGDTVTLKGLLIRMTYPGPPNYESIEDGDTPETYFVLKPDIPVSCATDSPQFGSKKLMQLVVKSTDYKKYQHLVGGKVTVAGILLYAETGHHHTPLMIEVKSLRAAED